MKELKETSEEEIKSVGSSTTIMSAYDRLYERSIELLRVSEHTSTINKLLIGDDGYDNKTSIDEDDEVYVSDNIIDKINNITNILDTVIKEVKNNTEKTLEIIG